MKKVLSLLIATLLITGFSAFNFANKAEVRQGPIQGPKWEKLGTRTVNMAGDHDEIPVTVFEGFFTKVKFKVLKAPIHVHNVNIIFGNGENKNIQVDRRFAPGDESKVIDLPGNKRVIKKIKLNYKTIPGHKGRAVVVVFGRH